MGWRAITLKIIELLSRGQAVQRKAARAAAIGASATRAGSPRTRKSTEARIKGQIGVYCVEFENSHVSRHGERQPLTEVPGVAIIVAARPSRATTVRVKRIRVSNLLQLQRTSCSVGLIKLAAPIGGTMTYWILQFVIETEALAAKSVG